MPSISFYSRDFTRCLYAYALYDIKYKKYIIYTMHVSNILKDESM